MSALAFAEGERASVDAAVEAAREALTPLGLWPARKAGGVHLPHRRAAVAAVRGVLGRKARHSEVAASTLEWARARGDVALYAIVAIGKAVEAASGPGGLAEAAAAHAPLSGATEMFDDLVAHLGPTWDGSIGREERPRQCDARGRRLAFWARGRSLGRFRRARAGRAPARPRLCLRLRPRLGADLLPRGRGGLADRPPAGALLRLHDRGRLGARLADVARGRRRRRGRRDGRDGRGRGFGDVFLRGRNGLGAHRRCGRLRLRRRRDGRDGNGFGGPFRRRRIDDGWGGRRRLDRLGDGDGRGQRRHLLRRQDAWRRGRGRGGPGGRWVRAWRGRCPGRGQQPSRGPDGGRAGQERPRQRSPAGPAPACDPVAGPGGEAVRGEGVRLAERSDGDAARGGVERVSQVPCPRSRVSSGLGGCQSTPRGSW